MLKIYRCRIRQVDMLEVAASPRGTERGREGEESEADIGEGGG